VIITAAKDADNIRYHLLVNESTSFDTEWPISIIKYDINLRVAAKLPPNEITIRVVIYAWHRIDSIA
jgi:hypothetical protein